MALIQCPECGRQVSDKAVACPECGYPISQPSQQYNCTIHGVSYDLTQVMAYATHQQRVEACKELEKSVELSFGENLDLVRIIEKNGEVPTKYPLTDTPRCPTCGSEKIHKLSAATRGVSLGLFGLASKTARSQFVCENCGYKW